MTGPAPRHLALVGPTASGKSALALEAARRLGDVELVSVDSMQVYRGMDIGTAKPTVAERSEVPCHLLDLADPSEDFSVARLQAAAAASPSDPGPVMELAVLYARNGDMSLARETLEDAARSGHLTGEAAARLQLVRARLALIEDRWNQAYIAAQEGLAELGGADDGEVAQRLWANVALALSSMGRHEQALAAFDRLRRPVVDDPRVLYARGLSRLACGDRAGGEADLRSVVGWRPEGDLLRQWAEAQLEGREPPPPDDSDRPNYARRTKAPPAPIAGV